MTGAVCAASDSNAAVLGSDLSDNVIAQHLDAVEDNASDKSINNDNNLNSENALKMGANTPDKVLADSGIITVNNWEQLKSAINDGAVIELSGDDVYYAEGSRIAIDSGIVSIDGKGHTIDAQGLNSHIFEINYGATLILKNIILKNAINDAFNDGDGGAIYIDQGTLTVIGCTFTNNAATSENGGAIYNNEGTLKIVNSKFEKNSKYGADGVSAEVVNQPKAIVNVSNNAISVSGLNAGKYALKVTTKPDANHTAVTKNVTITVNKINSKVNISDVEIDFGKSISVTADVEGATGITAKIDNGNVVVSGFNIPISGLTAGNHTLTVTTIVDDNHNPVTETAVITVNKVDSSLNVSGFEFDYDNAGFTVVSLNGANGVSAEVDNQPKASVNVLNNTIYVSGLNVGKYTLKVTTKPDANHTAVTKNVTITVNKIDSKVNVSDVEIDFGNSTSVTVDAEGATGITAKIDGDNVAVSGYDIPISGLTAGTHNLTVTTIADDNHNSVTKTAKITVKKIDSSLGFIDHVDLDYGSCVNITVDTIGASDIVAKIGDVKLNVTANKILVHGLDAGNYTLTVTTVADENHESVTKTASVTVNKVNSTLGFNGTVIDYGGSADIAVGHDGTVGITADIDGKTVSVNDYTIHVSDLSAGNHTLTVTSVPDINHNPVTETAIIVVNKVNLSLAISDLSLNYGSSTDLALGNMGITDVIAQIDGKNVAVSQFTIHVPVLNAGNHTLTVTAVPDDNHNPVTKTVVITVKKIDSSLANIKDFNLTYGYCPSITVTASGAKGITAKIGDKNLDVNGYSIQIPELDAGEYTLTVTTVPDDNHTEVARTASIKVAKAVSDVKIKLDSTDYNVGDSFTIGISNNTAATVTINGKTYSIKNGQVEIDITNLTAGTYTVIAKIAENNNYLPSSANVTFTVSKVQALRMVINVQQSVVEGSDLIVSVDGGDITGIVSINGKNITLKDGKASTTIMNVQAGELTINVIYFGDDKYPSSSKSVKVNVYAKKDANMKVSAGDIEVGQIATVNIEINPNVTGKVTIGDKEVSISYGKGTYSIENLPVGTYSFDVKFEGDAYFNADQKTVSFKVVKVETPSNDTNASSGNVTDNNSTSGNATENNNTNTTITKINPNLSVVIPDVNVGEDVFVEITMNSTINGKVVIIIYGNTYDLAVSNGKVMCKIPDLSAGSYSISVRFDGNDYFTAAEKTVSFKVIETQSQENGTNTSTGNITDNNETSGNATGNNTGNATGNNTNTNITKIDPNLSVSVSDVNAGETVVVNVSINESATGKIVVTVKCGDEFVSISNGKGTHSIPNLPSGDYSVTVKFNGDDYFNADIKYASFRVIETQTQTNDTNATTGNATEGNSTSGNATGNNTNATTGNATEGNSTSGNATGNNTNATITKLDPNLSVSVSDVNAGETVIVNVSIKENITGKVIVVVNGFEFSLDVSNGKATLPIANLTSGDYSVTVRFDGDDYFNADEQYASFRVIESQAPINDTNATTGNVTDGNSTSGNASGNNTGNATENNNTNTTTTKLSPELSVSVLDVNAGEIVNVIVSVKDNITGKVMVTLNGETKEVDIFNGKGTCSFDNLASGNYSVTVRFEGDDYFTADVKTASFRVIESQTPTNNTNATTGNATDSNSTSGNATGNNTNTSGNTPKPVVVDPVITGKNVNVLYTSNGKYSVTVYGTDGKLAKKTLVVFKINGKQVGKTYTDVNGVATYTINKVPGKYSITATALGKTVKNTINVKHIVTLKTVALKKSAKKLTLQATLAKVNGKVLKNKRITFKINGKKVATAKTNSKGVAKITIKNPSVVKKLKVGKKTTYQATYLKDTVKKTTKIKK